MTAVERLAMLIWRNRESSLPQRVRRMTPDATDFATGAWQRCLDRAARLMAERTAGQSRKF